MSIICPTVLAASSHDFREQMETVAPFADRVQIDLGDGLFTGMTVDVGEVWWTDGLSADIHLMHRQPSKVLDVLVGLRPALVIVHAEADDDLRRVLDELRKNGIRAGVALLQETTVEQAAELIKLVDHVLIFSGSLGSFGGIADLGLLRKVPLIRELNPSVEIGWDGGANLDSVVALRDGGIDVLNVGGAIQKANHPANAYRALVRAVAS